jgi:hypothetical protein
MPKKCPENDGPEGDEEAKYLIKPVHRLAAVLDELCRALRQKTYGL